MWPTAASRGVSAFRIVRYELESIDGWPPGIWEQMGKARLSSETRALRSGRTMTNTTRAKTQTQHVHQHAQDVAAALELAIEAVDIVVADINRQAQDSIAEKGCWEARALLDLAERLVTFRSTINESAAHWEGLGAELDGRPSALPRRARTAKTSQRKKARTRTNYGKVDPSEKTSQRDYLIPILEVLDELGGTAKASKVLEAVAERICPRFTPADLEPLASNPREPRWRNTAQWARQQLRDEGPLAPPQVRGVWELTDAGRDYLRDHSSGHD